MNLEEIKTASPEQLANIIRTAIALDPHAGIMIAAVAASKRLEILAQMGNEEAAFLADEVESEAFEASYEAVLEEAAARDADDYFQEFIDDLNGVQDEDYPDEYPEGYAVYTQDDYCDDPDCACRQQRDPGDENDHKPGTISDEAEQEIIDHYGFAKSDAAMSLDDVDVDVLDVCKDFAEQVGDVISRNPDLRDAPGFDVRLQVRSAPFGGERLLGISLSFERAK